MAEVKSLSLHAIICGGTATDFLPAPESIARPVSDLDRSVGAGRRPLTVRSKGWLGDADFKRWDESEPLGATPTDAVASSDYPIFNGLATV